MPHHAEANGCGDDVCLPRRPATAAGTVFSLCPFALTFVVVSVFFARRVFPRLSRVPGEPRDDGDGHVLPASAPACLRQAHADQAARSPRRRVAAAAFAATVGLAVVLAELILSDMSGLVRARARDLALAVTLPTLLFLLIVLIPFLELQSLLAGSGWSFRRSAQGRVPRVAWALQMAGFAIWLVVFWSLGKALPTAARRAGPRPLPLLLPPPSPSPPDADQGGLSRACLERIGLIGISLMALLSGFASVSSPWHTLLDGRAYRRRPITEADVARKQAGLDATSEMLASKRHRLRLLERKVSAADGGGGCGGGGGGGGNDGGASSGLVGMVMGSLKGIGVGGGGDAAEIKSLQLEISGLETMEATLASSLGVLRTRQAAHARDGTVLGRLLALPSHVFALYCVYRVLATTLTTLRRLYYSSTSFAASDPINRFLGLLAKHWDPALDQTAWARQISFLLSGVILAASANSALQTFHLFARWLPGLLNHAQANFALLIGQIAATYVISSALLLRSNLPREMGRSVGDALESALDPAFADGWFEGWFLAASVATAAGIWVGRRIGASAAGGPGDWDELDEYGAEEFGNEKVVKAW